MRPIEHLNAISKRYPKMWHHVQIFRQNKGKDSPDWPSWCFLPASASYAIVSEGGQIRFERLGDVALLSALIAWRYTQGIYRFEPSVYESISNTVAKGDLPVEVLFRLPEWGLYVETPGLNEYGFFAHLDYDMATGRAELRLLIDGKNDLHSVILHLGDWTVDEAIERAISEEAEKAGLLKDLLPLDAMTKMQSELAHHCVSLLLYLCSEQPDIEPIERELPARPKAKKVKGNWKLFPPKKPKVWRVGETIARQLSAALNEPSGETHNSPMPHIRRAHWHGYWRGSKGTSERKFTYKWLPPTVINANGV